MPENWDADYNADSVSVEQAEVLRREAEHNTWRRVIEEQAARRERRNPSFELPQIPNADVRARFPHYANRADNDENWWWTQANRPMWICHNCGAFGYKQTFRIGFKCYCCHQRNVTVVRAGDVADAVRASGIGMNMLNVWETRQTRRARARRTRT